MRNHNIRLEYKTPRASPQKEAPLSFESVKDFVHIEFNDEIFISSKGVELLFVLEAKIPVEVKMKLPNLIDMEYPIIDLSEELLEETL